MNDEIDWSQAPEGATHYVPSCERPWHKVTGENVWYWRMHVAEGCWLPYAESEAAEMVRSEGIPRPVERIDIIEPAEATPREQPLLPGNWLSLEPSDRKAALANKALGLICSLGFENYCRILVGFLTHTGLKKLADVSDDVFEQTRAMVAVSMMPRLADEAEIDWSRIDEIARQLLGISASDPAGMFAARVSQDPTPSDPYADFARYTEDMRHILVGDFTKLEERAVRMFRERHPNITDAWKAAAQPFPCEGYERLHDVYRDAHNQAAYEKGAQRHANDLPFHEQRMQTISQGLNSPDGMAYQVIKKLQEGLQMEDAGARRRELLGSLNYLAGIVIFLDDREAGGEV